MSKSNWKGTSGWSAILDPTGVLSGKVLLANAGLESITEDYLIQIPNSTSTDFTETNYSVIANFAWAQGTGLHPLSAGHFGLVARATNFSTTSVDSGNAYYGIINLQDGLLQIKKRYKSEISVLTEALLPSDLVARGVKHVMELRVYGTTTVTIQLYIDNTLFLSYGDNSSTIISSGFPGIHMMSGTCYVDNFSVVKYTSTGGSATLWTPTNISASNLAGWWKADTGTTIDSDNRVSAWTDNSANSNNFSQSTDADKPLLVANLINGLSVLHFQDSTDVLSAADSSSLDITSGVSVFIVLNPFSQSVPTSQDLLNKGTNYTITLTTGRAISYTTATTDTSSSTVTDNAFQLVEIISDSNFYLDGSTAGAITAVNGSANTDPLTISIDSGYLAEIILYDGIPTTDERQQIEGYLAHRWRISARLPSTHPYKGYAPLT